MKKQKPQTPDIRSTLREVLGRLDYASPEGTPSASTQRRNDAPDLTSLRTAIESRFDSKVLHSGLRCLARWSKSAAYWPASVLALSLHPETIISEMEPVVNLFAPDSPPMQASHSPKEIFELELDQLRALLKSDRVLVTVRYESDGTEGQVELKDIQLTGLEGNPTPLVIPTQAMVDAFKQRTSQNRPIPKIESVPLRSQVTPRQTRRPSDTQTSTEGVSRLKKMLSGGDDSDTGSDSDDEPAKVHLASTPREAITGKSPAPCDSALTASGDESPTPTEAPHGGQYGFGSHPAWRRHDSAEGKEQQPRPYPGLSTSSVPVLQGHCRGTGSRSSVRSPQREGSFDVDPDTPPPQRRTNSLSSVRHSEGERTPSQPPRLADSCTQTIQSPPGALLFTRRMMTEVQVKPVRHTSPFRCTSTHPEWADLRTMPNSSGRTETGSRSRSNSASSRRSNSALRVSQPPTLLHDTTALVRSIPIRPRGSRMPGDSVAVGSPSPPRNILSQILKESPLFRSRQ